MGKKGIKSKKGQGELWGEPKSERLSLVLTKTGKKGIVQYVGNLGMSVSETLEHLGRGILQISTGNNAGQAVNCDRIIGIAEVMKALRGLPLADLAKVAYFAGFLIKTQLRKESAQTIGQVVEFNQEQVAIAFNAVGYSCDRIQQIIDGSPPTPEELSLLSGVLPLQDEHLYKMFEEEFNDAKQHSTYHRSNTPG